MRMIELTVDERRILLDVADGQISLRNNQLYWVHRDGEVCSPEDRAVLHKLWTRQQIVLPNSPTGPVLLDAVAERVVQEIQVFATDLDLENFGGSDERRAAYIVSLAE